ncbi:MAG: C4-dicarboxylate-specific signal transduction histidine kinase, partial [Myxococcota bacterium]
VLHNVGNSVTSLSIEIELAGETASDDRASRHAARVVGLLEDNEANATEWLRTDRIGRGALRILRAALETTARQQGTLAEHIALMHGQLQHVKVVLQTQQEYAGAGRSTERIHVDHFVREAMALQAASMQKHGVEVEQCLEADEHVVADRHKVLQILNNLVKNGAEAQRTQKAPRMLRVVTSRHAEMVRLTVQDNGEGIPADVRERVFQHGFTTKPDGHGFGLHMSALHASELGGCLRLAQAGEFPELRGAAFVLELPVDDTVEPHTGDIAHGALQ